MRIDFREERKWKIALAFNLARAVMEWHEAVTQVERLRRGICVSWKRRRPADGEESQDSGYNTFTAQNVEARSGATSKAESTPVDNDNSDEDSDEEQEREQQDVIDALDPSTAAREAFEDADLQLERQPTPDLQPKEEYVENTSVLQRAASIHAMDVEPAPVDSPAITVPKAEVIETPGLKLTSNNPILGEPDSGNDIVSGPSKPKLKSSLLAPLREQIVYSEVERLFLDLDDFDIVKSMSSLSTNDAAVLAPPPLPDLTEIFPDMQMFSLLDVPSAICTDSKKKSGRGDKDDPNKRTEDATYMKVLPANDFMCHKITLLGALQPSKHYDDGVWHDLDEAAVVIDYENVSSRSVDESLGSGNASLLVLLYCYKLTMVLSFVRQYQGISILVAYCPSCCWPNSEGSQADV